MRIHVDMRIRIQASQNHTDPDTKQRLIIAQLTYIEELLVGRKGGLQNSSVQLTRGGGAEVGGGGPRPLLPGHEGQPEEAAGQPRVYGKPLTVVVRSAKPLHQTQQAVTLQRGGTLASYATMIYTDPCVMLLMRAASITRASGSGWGPGNRDFFGPCEMTSSR
jgi:hypothetical protein